MTAFLLLQGEYLLRILGAAFCGAFIGYERESHLKMAGIRTHTIVSLTSALMMIISKYGFSDVISNSVTLDPSRIAAGVVTGIGFLGAGIIFTRKMNVVGIVTASGLWATVAIGLAFGAGMYLIGIITTGCIIIMQFLFHHNLKFLKSSGIGQISLIVEDTIDVSTLLAKIFETKKMKISNVNAHRLTASTLEIKLYVKFPEEYSIPDVVQLLKDYPEIKTIDL